MNNLNMDLGDGLGPEFDAFAMDDIADQFVATFEAEMNQSTHELLL
jgi:hypothetical protein